MDKQILDEHSGLFLNEYKQTYEGFFLHPEAGEEPGVNNALNAIRDDINSLDDILVTTGQAIDDLLTNTTLRLDNVKQCIISEKERYQDMQMLCNKYTDFDNVQEIDDIKFSGDYTYSNGTYSAAIKKYKKNNITIMDVNGNGYEGNEYVYGNFEYQKNIYDTSLRENMLDNKISTYYEYSRITVPGSSEETISYFNKDSEKARCTITFHSDAFTNIIDLSTEDLGINIVNAQYSVDGIKFHDLNIPSKMSINNKLDSYDNYGYIYGSGIISIPVSKEFKLTFETTENKDDTIAYEKVVFSDQYNQIDEDTIPDIYTTTTVLEGAKRSTIRLNDVSCYKNIYSTTTKIQSSELMSMHGYAIALFANVYIPEGLTSSAVTFILTINGVDYEVVPINSNLNGTKVIRFSGGKSNLSYTRLINEKITSAKLTMIFTNKSDITPFVSNIKILIGGEI